MTLITLNSLAITPQPVDGRLCFGNGYIFGCFVGPLELPEKPIYKVHDKISRLWLGYSSSPSIEVGWQPEIIDTQTGKKYVVHGVDNYYYEDGVVFMETKLPVGKVITETYGLWQKPVFVRKIKFIPNDKTSATNFVIKTKINLFKEHYNKPPAKDDKDAWRYYNVYKTDDRERPVTHLFPAEEKLNLDSKTKNILWDYKDERYRKIVVKQSCIPGQFEIAVFHCISRPRGKESRLIKLLCFFLTSSPRDSRNSRKVQTSVGW